MRHCLLLLITLCILATTALAGKPAKPVPYAKISPLLKAECVSCHNPARHPEKVDLSSYTAIMASGEHGPIVAPGNAVGSKLIQYVDGEKKPRMPYHKAALKASQVVLLRAWINGGALR